jgi:transcriptional regulator with XRE-family HTH domain
MSRIFSENLNQILTEPDARVTARELAEEINVSRDMIYKVKNGKAELGMSKARALAHYLCKRGDKRLSRCFLTPDFVIKRRSECRVNGDVDDDLGDMNEAAMEARKIFQDGGSRADYDEHLDQAEQAIRTARAEGGTL